MVTNTKFPDAQLPTLKTMAVPGQCFDAFFDEVSGYRVWGHWAYGPKGIVWFASVQETYDTPEDDWIRYSGIARSTKDAITMMFESIGFEMPEVE